MHIDQAKLGCDEQLLRRYLDQELTADEEAEIEAHLDQCPRCRQRIGDSAAEPLWWTAANSYLKRDDLDVIGEQWSIRSGVASRDQTEGSAQVIVRQIQEWLDPSDHPKYIGRFGGYEILGVVGHGGMGVVLKGFEPALHRYVAIKVLSPALATSGAARQRFAREAQAAAAVLHENVIAIHRVDETHGLPYLVMPFVGGMSLQRRIDDEGPLPLPAILRIGRQIASGLAAAHAQGLVHRDIKPANILLDRGVDRVTITDFGLARAADDGSLTRTGVIAGTPQYMSPEQSQGDAIDARSDLFSLGSVMYAMGTGHPPFRAETGYGILRRITDAEPRPVREINPEIPEWFEAILRRLHAKNPQERFQSAAEVAELLEDCLAHVQQPTAVPLPDSLLPRTTRGRILPLHRKGVIAMFATFSLVLMGMLLLQTPESPNGSNNETGDKTPPAAPADNLSPAADSQQSDPRNPRGATALAKELEPFQGTWKFAACESEVWVAELDQVRTWRWTVQGNQITWTGPDAQEWTLSFSVDPAQSPKQIDLKFLTGPHRGITCRGIYDRQGKSVSICLQDPEAITDRPKEFSFTGDGGRSLIMLTLQPEKPVAAIRTLEGTWKFRVCQSEWWPVWKPSAREAFPQWRWVVAEDQISWTGPGFDGTKASFTIDAARTPKHLDITILDGPHRGTSSRGIYELKGTSLWICLSDPGSNVKRPADFSFESGGERSLIILDRVNGGAAVAADPPNRGAADDQKPLILLGHEDQVTSVAFSPDGKLVASSSWNGTIKIWDADTGREVHTLKRDSNSRVWKRHRGPVYDVAFSPDGNYLASADNDKSVRVWHVKSGRPGLTHPRKYAFMSVAYSPDGKLLAAADYTSVRVWDNTRDSSTGAHREVLVLDAEQPLSVAFSPDGKWLASAGRDKKLWVRNTMTGEKKFSFEYADALFRVVFSPDGKRLFTTSSTGVNVWDATTGRMLRTMDGIRGSAISPDGKLLAGGQGNLVKFWDAATGKEVLSLQGHGNTIRSVAFSPDGTRLASGSRDRTVRIWTLPPRIVDLEEK